MRGLMAVMAGLLLTAGAADAQKIYKWTDAGGRVQYTNTPPPAGVPFSTLGPPPAPDAEAASQARARAQRSIDEAARAADERRRAQTQRDAQAESDRVQGAERQVLAERLGFGGVEFFGPVVVVGHLSVA